MKIKNVVFDVGNVLVRWAPFEVIKIVFPEFDPEDFYKKIRPIWIDLNLGKFTENEAISLYHSNLGLSTERLFTFMFELKRHQTPLNGSIELLNKLQKLGINLFAITDNVKEIMDYHRKFSEFPRYFKDIIVSSDVGFLKPDSRIYQHLLNNHNLHPNESIFINDTLTNVEGAMAVGMKALQFIDTESCEKRLIKLLVS